MKNTHVKRNFETYMYNCVKEKSHAQCITYSIQML